MGQKTTFGVCSNVAKGIEAQFDVCHTRVTAGLKAGFPSWRLSAGS
jgi:hypothetical protein